MPEVFPNLLSWLKRSPNAKAILILKEILTKGVFSVINHLSYSGQVKPYKTVEGFINNVDETLLYQLIEFSNYPRILKQIKEYDVDHQFCILSF